MACLLRNPDGSTSIIHSSTFTHRADNADSAHCVFSVGRACSHGYRLDYSYNWMNGDKCRVVATHPGRRELSQGLDDLSPELRSTLPALRAGDPVEVLLDDGRVGLPALCMHPGQAHDLLNGRCWRCRAERQPPRLARRGSAG